MEVVISGSPPFDIETAKNVSRNLSGMAALTSCLFSYIQDWIRACWGGANRFNN